MRRNSTYNLQLNSTNESANLMRDKIISGKVQTGGFKYDLTQKKLNRLGYFPKDNRSTLEKLEEITDFHNWKKNQDYLNRGKRPPFPPIAPNYAYA